MTLNNSITHVLDMKQTIEIETESILSNVNSIIGSVIGTDISHELLKPYIDFFTTMVPILCKFVPPDQLIPLFGDIWKKCIINYRPLSSTGYLIIGKRKNDSIGSFFSYELSFRDPNVRINEWKDRLLIFSEKCADTDFGETFSFELLRNIRTQRPSEEHANKIEIEWFLMDRLVLSDIKFIVDQVCLFVKKIKEIKGINYLNINSASVEQLMTMKQIGETRAKLIYEIRTKNGPFNCKSDLYRIPGFSDGIICRIVELFYFGEANGKCDPNYKYNSSSLDNKKISKIMRGTININTGSRIELRSIQGIGPAYCDRIMKHRPFKNMEDVEQVLPSNVYMKIRNFIRLVDDN